MMRIRSSSVAIVLPLAAGAVLQGCAGLPHPLGQDSLGQGVPVTQAALPTTVEPYPRIERTLACIRDTGVLKHQTFVVGPFADSTGKINAVAPGSTGNFVPQGGSAAYITDALRKAGARVVSTYFGPPSRQVSTQYAINGIFNSLDFGSPVAADVRIAGIGPTAAVGWAQLSLTIQLDQVATKVNRQISLIQRPIRYSQLGVGTGRDFGGTLVTGNIAIQNQERLQLEALNGPIALGVADVVMKEYPIAHEKCARIVGELLTPAELRDPAGANSGRNRGEAAEAHVTTDEQTSIQ
ncbi:MAG: hypothetical protein WC807_16380 [Hyphomicrobium sp.]